MANNVTPRSAGCRLSLVIRVLEEETQDSGKISKATVLFILAAGNGVYCFPVLLFFIYAILLESYNTVL